ncbi:chromosome-associated kinesin KIF4-like isoform X3 [Mytilus trossulus]|uniref:chromosome-associated kinesin KIF4-like isoform X1 n=1 Tax=Mytilus trossulus TaxID=6551 RepID=UPI0030073EE2
MTEDKVIPVRVAIRCRPLITKELNEGCQKCVRFIDNEPQLVLGSNRSFTYDYVYSPDHSQHEVYDSSVKHLVKHIFKGYNATVLAYGQTGSGKTYTMGGCYDMVSEIEKGVIPRVMQELFNGMEDRPEYLFTIKVSYLEIYNEDINDLLCPMSKREPLAIREDATGGIRLPGLREKTVTSYEETLTCLSMGGQVRTTGATAMNNTSSRSHAIFTIHVEMKKKDDENDTCSAKFHLVDLAGSERAKKTQAEGERFKEGVNINRGLLCLGNVISALGDDKEKRSYIPYRDSKLTRLLQDSLGGNSYTLMVACISPADTNMEETLNTLRYADRARKIKNKPIINRDPQTAEIIRLKQLVIELETRLQSGGLTIKCESSVATCTSVFSSTSSTAASTSMSYVDQDSIMDKVKELSEKNKQLEEENEKLSDELQRAVDNSANLCEKVIKLDLKCERLKNRLDDFKKDTGLDFNVLSSSLDVNSHPELKEQMDKLRHLAEQVNDDKDEPEESIPEQDEDMDQGESLPGTPDSRAMSKEYAFRQAKMTNELQELNKLLEKKERLAKQMTQNDDQMKAMKGQYDHAISGMNSEIESLQKEKEELAQALENAKYNSATSKVAEQRRQRLKELEQQMSQLKRKVNDQTKLLKMKEQSEKQVSKMNVDIQGMKQQRVKLMKQMKEDADEFRRWKMKKEKEVMQLQQKGRKRDCEIAKLQRENQKQQNILKRKGEEAAAANKRLKEALAKQKQVHQERNEKFEKYDTTSIGNRVRSWLSHELEVRVSIREAKYHLNRLLSDRKEMVMTLKDLKDRIDEDAPPTKKLAWIKDGKLDSSSFEVENVKKQIEEVQQQIDERNAQITDLQQKVVDADQECKGKSIWESLHTMVEAKCALKWLLEQAVSSRADSSKAQGELQDSKLHHIDRHDEMEELQKEIEDLKHKHEDNVTRLQKQHEDKVLFLLRQMKAVDSNVTLDVDVRQRMKFQQEEIDKLSKLHEEVQKKNDECESLKQHLTKAMYQGKSFALMPSIDADHEVASPFLTPKPKAKAKRKTMGKDESFMSEGEYFAAISDEEDNVDEDEDEEVNSDEEWWRTPKYKRKQSSKIVQPKKDPSRNSITKCNCKGNCLKKICGCRKQGIVCSDHCKCSNQCRNIEQPGSTTNPDDDSISTTLNSTYNLEEKENISSQNSSANEFVEPMIPKRKSHTNNNSEISSSTEGATKKRRLLTGSNSFFKPL